jgi:hypothetical protein
MNDKKLETVFTLEIVHDEIVESVRNDLLERSNKGQSIYGTTLENNNHDDFLQHAIEEAMDFILYLKKIQTIIKLKGYNNLNELDSINNS